MGRLLAAVAGLVIVALPAPALAHDLRSVTSADGGLNSLNPLDILSPKNQPVTGGPDQIGTFSAPFTEPTVDGAPTAGKCLTDTAGVKHCKPAGASVNVLPDGRILYWDALEGTENVKYTIVGEFGAVATNDAARLLTLGGQPSWTQPNPVDGGANPNGSPPDALIPGLATHEKQNDGALFGSTQSYLPDGRILVQGGTDYSLDPGVDGSPFGVTELGGLRSTRIFDPKTNAFAQTGDTHRGRWYPTLVELGDGKQFVASGVRKLLKPAYLDDPLNSGTNVRQTETYDPATGKWTDDGAGGERDLPLYPRLHLLPDGKVFYNTAGQDFNPFGQSVGELGWGVPAVYDPAKKQWSALSPPDGLGGLTDFRGSTSSTMLPLTPDKDGSYTQARFLTAGGVLGPSPGSYFAVRDSRIRTVDTSHGDKVTDQKTGDLNQTRWFSSMVLLPTGEVVAFSGADRDEVLGPGVEFPIQQAELFNPKTNTWKAIASAHQPRTYHNTAVLLPDATVLVGGHAPISTLYANNTTLPGGFAPHDGRDPSFEYFKPPYLFRGAQPKIVKARDTLRYGSTFGIRTDVPADEIESVVLVRNAATTHLVDGGQRNVELPIRGRDKKLLLAGAPPKGDVAPPGPYLLYVNKRTDKGPVPSVAKQVFVQ